MADPSWTAAGNAHEEYYRQHHRHNVSNNENKSAVQLAIQLGTASRDLSSLTRRYTDLQRDYDDAARAKFAASKRGATDTQMSWKDTDGIHPPDMVMDLLVMRRKASLGNDEG